jgi:hypothetical protein
MVYCGCDLFLTAFFTFVGYSVLKKTKTTFLRWMCFMFFISAFSGLLFNFDYLWLIYGGGSRIWFVKLLAYPSWICYLIGHWMFCFKYWVTTRELQYMFFIPSERTLTRRLHYKIMYWSGIATIAVTLAIILSLKTPPLYVWYAPMAFDIIFLVLIVISLWRLTAFIKLYPDILLLDNKMIFIHLLMFVLLTFISSMALP